MCSNYFTDYLLIKPLGELKDQVRAVRYGGKGDGPIEIEGVGYTADLAHEFNRVYKGNNQLRKDLADSRVHMKNEMSYHTTILSRKIRQLQKKACSDSMTGLANRRYYDDYSQMLFEHSVRNGSDLVCLMIDVDNFKQVNDKWGHDIGDNIIIFAGELIKACTRQGDLCARYGGDEFVVLLKDCSRSEAEKIAERARKHFAREVKVYLDMLLESRGVSGNSQDDIKAVECQSWLSIGIASMRKNQPGNVRKLMRMADEALYQAKLAGRNCVRAYG